MRIRLIFIMSFHPTHPQLESENTFVYLQLSEKGNVLFLVIAKYMFNA